MGGHKSEGFGKNPSVLDTVLYKFTYNPVNEGDNRLLSVAQKFGQLVRLNTDQGMIEVSVSTNKASLFESSLDTLLVAGADFSYTRDNT